MGSIIDEIAAAEQQAEELRQQAAAQARETTAKAQADAESALSDMEAKERDTTREALQKAEQDGEEAARDILSGMEHEADALCATARERVEDAIAYLMKKVTEAS